MTTRIKLRRDTAANWLLSNPILAAGEPGLETDTGKVKYGNGTTAWTGLAYAGGDTLADDGSVVITAGSTEHWIATQRKDGDDTRPRGLRYDSEGNLYTLTKTEYDGGEVAVITKYTATGAVAWQKSFTDVEPLALAVDSTDHAYITLGLDASVVTVVKFSVDGTTELWKKDYDIGPAPAIAAYIEEKSSTTLAVAFSIFTTGQFPNVAIIMEISADDGTVQIKRQLAQSTSTQVLFVTGIDVDPDENVFVTGYYEDPAESNKGKMFIEKLDENLGRVWSKSLETNNSYDMNGGDCASDALGNIYVVGSYDVDLVSGDGEGNNSAGILTKLNSSGVVQWTRRIGPGPCGSFIVGLTATDTGDVYLSATTFAKRTDGAYADADQFSQEAYGDNKLIVARYNTQGDVIWQRYVDVKNLLEESGDSFRGQAIAVFGDMFAVDGYGQSWNTIPWNLASTTDNEDDYFVVQLPTDGTELTIGNLDFTESRVPARKITHTTTNSPLINTAYAENILAEDSTLTADVNVQTANHTVKSEAYEYTFGADGTLNIPNDGDLRLTQTQVGYLMAVGGSQNYNWNILGRAVAVDSQKNMYLVGGEEQNNQPFVMKINPEGVREWAVTIYDDDNGNDGRANGVAIEPATGNVIVACEMWGTYTYSVLFNIDQDTGRILDYAKYSDNDSDVYLTDIAYTNSGTSAIAGSKYGEFSPEYPVTAITTASTTGTIVFLKSDLITNLESSYWQIGGTGIDPFEIIRYVERYTGLSGTTRQGSNATFDIIDNGNGTYSAGISTSTTSTNYLVGHKIKILGTDLGGATPDNDCVITVDAAYAGAITGVSNAGTAAGTVTETYSARTGTNYLVGSGFTFDFFGPRYSTNYNDLDDYTIVTPGSNYVINDVITVLGTGLGGATTANDLTVTVNSVNTGAVTNLGSFEGRGQTSTWKLETYTQVDFASTGSWAITYPLSRENLLITDSWTRTFGTNGDRTDRLYATAVDRENNIIAVGQGYGLLGVDNNDDLAMVYKFNSTGTLQWARKLNEKNSDCYAMSVATIGTDIYTTHYSDDNGETVITKLTAGGTVKWQRITYSSDDSIIAATPDGNLLVAVEAYNSENGYDCLKVFMLTPSSEIVYKRWLTAATDENTHFKNGRGLVVDGDSFYITGYFEANNYNSALAARLPLDGSGTGEYGSFRYVDVNTQDGNYFNEDYVSSDNYSIDLVDLEDANNYAGALAAGEAPYVNTGTTVTVGGGDFGVNTFTPNANVETVRDTDGGNIVFADGSTQNTSATDIPQRRFWGQRYTLGMEDRGRHILCNEDNDRIVIPYNARVEFPIGTKIVIVNKQSGSVDVRTEGGSISLIIAGDYRGYDGSAVVKSYGVGTLLKIGRDEWIIFGDVDID